MLRASVSKKIATILAIACFFFAIPASSGEGDRYHWKPVDRAQLKIDGNTPLSWNVYQPDKKKPTNLILILLGRRYIALDTKTKIAYQVFPTDLQAKDKEFDSGDLFRNDRQIPSSDWTVKDVGPAEQIRLTLKDYGRTIEVYLPHRPDLRAFY